MSLKKMMVAASIATVLGTTAVTAAFAADTAKTDLLANVDHVQWLDVNRLIASTDTEEGRMDYIVYLNTGKFVKLQEEANASELVVSPDGGKAAYSDSNGYVYVLDLVKNTSQKVNDSADIKAELVWSNDGKALYFLKGDKGGVVSKLDIATGTITAVFDDKDSTNNVKSNLNVSLNGNRITYTYTVLPKVTAPAATTDADIAKDDVTIDATAGGFNFYKYDVSANDNKSVQLTKTTDEKMFVGVDPNGNESYFINLPADTNAKSTLVAVDSNGKTRTVFDSEDVYQAKYVGGLLYLLTSGPAGKNKIFTVNSAGVSNLLYTVDDTTTDIEVSKGGLVAIEKDGKTYVDLNGNGQWQQVTN